MALPVAVPPGRAARGAVVILLFQGCKFGLLFGVRAHLGHDLGTLPLRVGPDPGRLLTGVGELGPVLLECALGLGLRLLGLLDPALDRGDIVVAEALQLRGHPRGAVVGAAVEHEPLGAVRRDLVEPLARGRRMVEGAEQAVDH